jgi:hypothetical protein
MPTLLTNPRMPPSLQRRLEARLAHPRGRRGRARVFVADSGPSRTRWIVLGSLAVVIGLMVAIRSYEERDIDRRRDALLAAVGADRNALTGQQIAFAALLRRWATDTAASTYPGDFLPPLGGPGELDEWLTRPTVYVRGAAPELADADTVRQAASTSTKDSFLLCLVVPPHTGKEATVLSAVRGVNYGGAMVERLTFNVRRLHDAEEGLQVLGTTFHEQVVAADKPTVMKDLEKVYQSAPIDAGMLAATAELAVIVADEPPPGMVVPKSPPRKQETSLLARIEERPHDARVAIVDLAADRLLLRVRRRLDAYERFPSSRALHAAAVQGCGLALDVRAAAEDDEMR